LSRPGGDGGAAHQAAPRIAGFNDGEDQTEPREPAPSAVRLPSSGFLADVLLAVVHGKKCGRRWSWRHSNTSLRAPIFIGTLPPAVNGDLSAAVRGVSHACFASYLSPAGRKPGKGPLDSIWFYVNHQNFPLSSTICKTSVADACSTVMISSAPPVLKICPSATINGGVFFSLSWACATLRIRN